MSIKNFQINLCSSSLQEFTTLKNYLGYFTVYKGKNFLQNCQDEESKIYSTEQKVP